MDASGIYFEVVPVKDPKPITQSRLCLFQTTIQSMVPKVLCARFGAPRSTVKIITRDVTEDRRLRLSWQTSVPHVAEKHAAETARVPYSRGGCLPLSSGASAEMV